MGVVKVNTIPFLATTSKVMKLGSATELINTKKIIVSALLVLVDIYTTRGFKILVIVADYEFEAMQQDEDFIRTEITLNTTSDDEHKQCIERFNRFLKEGIFFLTLSFLKIPRRMTVELVYLQI